MTAVSSSMKKREKFSLATKDVRTATMAKPAMSVRIDSARALESMILKSVLKVALESG
jgi:hypothetical protein